MKLRLTLVALTVFAAGCASKSDLRTFETSMLSELRTIRAAQDSLSLSLRGAFLDSLQTQQRRELQGRSEQQRRLDQIQQSLAQVLDLIGQIQRELGRGVPSGAPAVPVTPTPGVGAAGGEEASSSDAASQLYNSAQSQFNRGSYQTARAGFGDFLRLYSDHELAPDAQFYLARTYEETAEPDAALLEFARVLELYPNSRRAPSALYSSGRIELDRGNTQDAVEFFSRVVRGYPNSDEAILAEQRLSDLRR